MEKSWIQVAKEKWGEEWGTIAPITIATIEDDLDSHRNKYYQVMGEYPIHETNLTRLPKCVPPEVYWAGAQHHIGQMGLSGRLT
eukprot:1183950-Karenia_brevis.AAC.1